MPPSKRPIDSEAIENRPNKFRKLRANNPSPEPEFGSDVDDLDSSHGSRPPLHLAPSPKGTSYRDEIEDDDACDKDVCVHQREIVRLQEQLKQLGNDLEESNRRVERVEEQRGELIKFVQNNEGKFPSNVQAQIDTYPATKLAARIREQADAIYDEVYADLQCEMEPTGYVNAYSCRSCHLMAKLLPEVETLTDMPGGVALAFDLALYFARKTILSCDKHCIKEESVWTYHRDVFDRPADEILYCLATSMQRGAVSRRHLDEITVQRKAFVTTKTNDPDTDGNDWVPLYIQGNDIKTFVDFIDSYFPTSYALIWSLVVGHSGVGAYAEELKHIIRKDYTEIVRDAETWETSSSQLSQMMCDYIPAVRRLINMHGGRKHASSIFRFMSKKSIPFSDCPTDGKHHSRPSDAILDYELVSLCAYNDFTIPSYFELKALVAEANMLEEHGINNYLPKYRTLLSRRLSTDERPDLKELALQLLPKETEIPDLDENVETASVPPT